MKMKLTETLSVLLAVSLCTGCFVKEDRTSCPCLLRLDFSEVDTDVIKAADVLVTSADGFSFFDTVASDGFDGYEVTVPRSSVTLNLWYGAGSCLTEDNEVSIPYGDDCPPVYMFVTESDASGELCSEKIVMHKNHCVMTLYVETETGLEYRLAVRGCVSGYKRDGTPASGDFLYRTQPDSAGKCVVVLPRQVDNSLMLDIDDGEGGGKTFALRESVAAGGYDWNSADLADVEITLDYALSDIVLHIEEWNGVYDFNVVL